MDAPVIGLAQQIPNFAGLTLWSLIGLAAVIAVVVLAALLAILSWRPDILKVDSGSQGLRNREMIAEIDKLKGQVGLLLDQLVTAEGRFRVETAKRQESEARISVLQEEIAGLRKQLEAKKLIAPLPEPKSLCVLAIWTQAPGLDPQANADTLSLAGVDYQELIGPRASMEAILYALPLRSYTTLEIGAKGDAAGIQLQDGYATAQWWSDLASEFPTVNTFLFLSDNSGDQGQTALADRVFQAPGVNAVISVDGLVEDVVARRFAKMLYARLVEGKPLDTAVRLARMAVGPTHGKLFRLRKKPGNGA